MAGAEKTRYSDSELKEFKEIILKKIDKAEQDLDLLREQFANDKNKGSSVMSKESNSQLAARQEKFIRDLKNALIRIENKTYGICRVTGKLIEAERLKLVPHATMSMEAKLKQR